MKIRHKKYGFIAEWVMTTPTNYFVFDVDDCRGCEPMFDFECL